MFGTPSTSPSLFGTPSSSPALFGTPSSSPAFGTPAFGTPSSAPAFGTPSSTPAFGTPSSTPAFGTPFSTPAFGTPSTPAFGSTPSPFFQQQQQQPSFSTPFPLQLQNPNPSPFGGGFGTPFGNAQPQITTQMAPVTPISVSLTDRDLQAIIDAYKEEPANNKYAFRHLLFSVTDPAARVKPVGASDIMWAEAIGKLEGMESVDRERLWPQLVQGFKDLSNRLKLQDEVIVSDDGRLRMTQNNTKMLQRHLQADTLPWVQRMKLRQQALQRRLLRVTRIVEALEGKGIRVSLMKPEVELADKLAGMAIQLKGPGAELPKKVHNLLAVTRVHANGGVGSAYLPASARIHEQSLAEMQEVLQQQTEAIARLGNVLKRDTRDMEIIMSEDTHMSVDGGERQNLKS
ncbi:nuclear pore complex protein NUP54 [Iris pallida]|uniref:Nuclear pore complex protein NUP54 n=1 Tax=Iris pallida TaxID=29817 RepID=A0AAX6FSK5_IRIPA|nr:nuclear pore complex protein NUP54 [Iris pallida]